MRRINTKGLPAYIKGFFTVLAGIVFIVFPDAVSNVIGILFAIILIVMGITGAVDYIISIKDFKAAGYGKSVGAEIVLVYSVIVMILGIIFLIRPDFVLNILGIFAAGIACIIDPFSGTRGIIIFSGITFIASGIETVILSLKGK